MIKVDSKFEKRLYVEKVPENVLKKYPEVPGGTCPHWYSKFACSCSDASTKVCRYQIVKNILNCNKIPNCKKYTKLRLGLTSEKGFEKVPVRLLASTQKYREVPALTDKLLRCLNKGLYVQNCKKWTKL